MYATVVCIEAIDQPNLHVWHHRGIVRHKSFYSKKPTKSEIVSETEPKVKRATALFDVKKQPRKALLGFAAWGRGEASRQNISN